MLGNPVRESIRTSYKPNEFGGTMTFVVDSFLIFDINFFRATYILYNIDNAIINKCFQIFIIINFVN